MTGNNSTVSANVQKSGNAPKPRTKRKTTTGAQLLPEPEQIPLFTPELANWPLKDDLASMEVPLFSLSKSRDIENREYKRGNTKIKVMPSSVYGAATVFDKDLLLYVSSHIVAAMNDKKAVSRTVKIDSFDFLTGTGRSDGGASFENILGMLRRLKGTNIETNIETGGKTQTDGFSLIDSYQILSEKKRTDRNGKEKTGVMSFTVTISDWLWNGLREYEILSMDHSYFSLPKPIQRRLYEVARKHCGTEKAMWKIDIDLLAEKIGFKRDRANFRSELRAIIQADSIPQYRLALDTSVKPARVVFFTKDVRRFNKWLSTERCFDWYNALERQVEVESASV